jgi:hypothetical protein
MLYYAALRPLGERETAARPIRRYRTTPDGAFSRPRGGIIQDSAYGAVWAEVGKTALTPAQHRSPLGRRPYDLRR